MAPGRFRPGATSRIIGPTGNKVQPQGDDQLFFGVIERTQFGDVSALWATWSRSRVIGYGVHIFVVRGVMIDTGFPGVANEMRRVIANLRSRGATLRGAMLTHHHEDHAGNLRLLVDAGVPVAMDAETLERVRQPGRIGFYRHFTWKVMPPLLQTVTPFTDDTLSLIPTPGHCSNHHSVWDAETGTCFAGDLYLGARVRVAHSYEDPRAHVDSLRRIIARDPARVFCAHRGFVDRGVARLRAKADWIDELIGRVEQRLDAGQSDEQVRRELLGRLGRTHFMSAGDYSPRNLITAIRNTRPNGSAVGTDPTAPPSAPRAHQ